MWAKLEQLPFTPVVRYRQYACAWATIEERTDRRRWCELLARDHNIRISTLRRLHEPCRAEVECYDLQVGHAAEQLVKDVVQHGRHDEEENPDGGHMTTECSMPGAREAGHPPDDRSWNQEGV
jgi:hypothetical protein